jgi:bifunctional DNA-binding transcriptional regulator/antitoxin component of YhaV-PrlF toxin-antitoxin module
VIPVEYQRALGVKEGDEFLARYLDGEMRITTPEAAIRRAQALVKRDVSDGILLADELIRERRRAAEDEL